MDTTNHQWWTVFAHYHHDAAPADVLPGRVEDHGTRVVETVWSDAANGPRTFGTRDGLAVWHEYRTNPVYAWAAPGIDRAKSRAAGDRT